MRLNTNLYARNQMKEKKKNGRMERKPISMPSLILWCRSILKCNRIIQMAPHHVKILTAFVSSNLFKWGASVDESKITQIFFQRRTAALHTDFDAWLIITHWDLDCLVRGARRLHEKCAISVVFHGLWCEGRSRMGRRRNEAKSQTLNPWNSF